jgi:O-antigen ligase
MSRGGNTIYDRAAGWALPLIGAATPLMVLFPMKPTEQQAYFFIAAVLAWTAVHGLAWIVGARPQPGRPTLPILLGIGLGVSVGVSIALSGQYYFGMKKALLPLCAFLYLGHLVGHPRRLAVLQRTTVLMGVVSVLLAAYGIAQFFDYEFLSYSEDVQKNKVIATIGHPNFLGSVLGPMAFVLLSLTLGGRGRWLRWFAVAGIFLLLLCITLARTRAVWLGMVCGFGALMLLTLRYALRHRQGWGTAGKLAAGLVVVIVAIGAMVLVVLPRMNRAINLADRLLSNYEIKSRLFYWNAAIDEGRDKPVFGNGVGMFDPLFWPYALRQQRSEMGPYYYDVLPAIAGKTPEHVHNEYLEVFCEQGAFGIGMVLAFLIYFLYFGYSAAMRCADQGRALALLCFYAALTMMMIDAAFGFPWRLPVSLIVFMLVIGWLYEGILPQGSFGKMERAMPGVDGASESGVRLEASTTTITGRD